MNSNHRHTSVRDVLRVVGNLTVDNRRSQATMTDTRPWERSEIADRFKALRKKVRLSQCELGKFLHIDRKSVCRIERSRTVPGPRTWKRFEEFEAGHDEGRIELPADWLRELMAASACRR